MQIRTTQLRKIKRLNRAINQTLRIPLATQVTFQKALSSSTRHRLTQQQKAKKMQQLSSLTQMVLKMKFQLRLSLKIHVPTLIRTHLWLKIKRLNQVINQMLRIQLATLVIFQKELSLNTRHQLIQQLKVTKTLQLSSLTQMVLRTKFQLR